MWDELEINPSVQLKEGILRQLYPLAGEETHRRDHIRYTNEYVRLEGKWNNFDSYGSELKFSLTNITNTSLRVTRIIFPTENGLDAFIRDFDPKAISFLRNGYQSWSTTRSYRINEKPLRPWLPIVSLASSNLANLPSNIPGVLSSEMFSCISDTRKEESFFIGQGWPFNQFFYIRLNLRRRENVKSYFEVVFDFGRKLLPPGKTIELDTIYLAKMVTDDLLDFYFSTIQKQMKTKPVRKHIRGWCSWYYYYNNINPDEILKNVSVIKDRDLPIDVVQIDDGYAQAVGDWFSLKPQFEGKMKNLADTIRDAGYRPGIWIAPFIAERKSRLATIHPEYLLRSEHGRKLTAGYNLFWPSRFYYGLDITNPRFEEYIRRVIRTIVHEWGYTYLKCDFLFGGCLRGGTHKDLTLSRAEVLKKGMNIIREEAGDDVIIVGCGMPLSTGIDTVDIMRVGPDTGPYWMKREMKLLRTGAMVGVRNSIRNVFVRAFTHKKLWVNDPDCVMLRRSNTKLNENERLFQINAIILSGGPLLVSDDVSRIKKKELDEFKTIEALSSACYTGMPVTPDFMEREIPHICYNTAGYIGFFNGTDKKKSISCDIKSLLKHYSPPDEGERNPDTHRSLPQSELEMNKPVLTDVWDNVTFHLDDNWHITLRDMPPHSSRLFKINV
jgi:alpha-galactosidase